jgi:hypothetical protein
MGSDDDIQKLKRIIAESTAKIEQTKSVASKENQDPSKSLESKKNIQELQHKNSKHELAVGIYKKLFLAICVYIILVQQCLNTHSTRGKRCLSTSVSATDDND